MQHLNNDDFIVFNITEILVINYSCHYVLAKLQFIAITAIFISIIYLMTIPDTIIKKRKNRKMANTQNPSAASAEHQP